MIKIILTELSQSVCRENLDPGREYGPHCVRSALTTSVKILPYRPPARLIRAKSDRPSLPKKKKARIESKTVPPARRHLTTPLDRRLARKSFTWPGPLRQVVMYVNIEPSNKVQQHIGYAAHF